MGLPNFFLAFVKRETYTLWSDLSSRVSIINTTLLCKQNTLRETTQPPQTGSSGKQKSWWQLLLYIWNDRPNAAQNQRTLRSPNNEPNKTPKKTFAPNAKTSLAHKFRATSLAAGYGGRRNCDAFASCLAGWWRPRRPRRWRVFAQNVLCTDALTTGSPDNFYVLRAASQESRHDRPITYACLTRISRVCVGFAWRRSPWQIDLRAGCSRRKLFGCNKIGCCTCKRVESVCFLWCVVCSVRVWN